MTLIESVNAGSFSKAAENLCVTPSAVSRRIKYLEDQYGYPLLDRSGPVLKATEVGKHVIEKAIKLLEIEHELIDGIKEIGKKPMVSFCCTPAFGIANLPGIFKDFMLQNLDINDLKFMFEMPHNVVKGLKENLYDLAVIEHGPLLELDDFTSFQLPKDEMIFISSPKLRISPRIKEIDTLFNYHLYSRDEGCCSKIFLDYNLKNIGRETSEFSKLIIYDDLHLIIQAILDGQGISFISKNLITKYLKDEKLRIHRVDGFEHKINRTLVLNTTGKPRKFISKFVKSIYSSLDLEPPDIF